MKIKDLPPDTDLENVKVKTPEGIIGRWRSQWGYKEGKAGVWLRCDESNPTRMTPICIDSLTECLEWEVIL